MFEIWFEKNQHDLEYIFDVFLENVKNEFPKLSPGKDLDNTFYEFCKMLYPLR